MFACKKHTLKGIKISLKIIFLKQIIKKLDFFTWGKQLKI